MLIKSQLSITLLILFSVNLAELIIPYVDTGNPYNTGPLEIGDLTLQKTVQGSPLHTKAWFPLQPGLYPVIFFIGGLNGIVLVEFYSTVLSDIASHGFFVFGVDPFFPIYEGSGDRIGQDLDIIFKDFSWIENYFKNRTLATPSFNTTGLMCHSSGCDTTLRMIRENKYNFTSSIFLEPASIDVKDKINMTLPSLMYGTQLSEEGEIPCAIKGMDYKAFYDIWTCPRVMMNVADCIEDLSRLRPGLSQKSEIQCTASDDRHPYHITAIILNFGHCDILDPVAWEGCHTTHFCKTTNDTYLPMYRKFVQGLTSAFYIATLQGRSIDLQYASNATLIPLKLLELETDFKC